MTPVTDTKDKSTANAQASPDSSLLQYAATGPNQIWVWGVSSYMGPKLTKKYHCYICEDIYSRCIMGCGISLRDDVDTAVTIISGILDNNKITPSTGLMLHSSHGKVMQAPAMQAMLTQKGVEIYQKRPGRRVKTYIAALFSRLNGGAYGLGSYYYNNIDLCMEAVTAAVSKYNTKFIHGSISYATPAQRQHGLDLKTEEDPETGEIKTIDPIGPQFLCSEDEYDYLEAQELSSNS